jgi:hypothetical protein
MPAKAGAPLNTQFPEAVRSEIVEILSELIQRLL